MPEASNQFMESLQIGGPKKLPGSEMVVPNSVRIAIDIEGNINKGRIQGKDGEMWADWLVKDIKEFDDITNPALQTKIRLIARRGDVSVTPTYLEKIHNEIDEMVEGGLSLQDASVWMERIETRQELLVANEKNTPTVVSVAHDKEAIPARDQPLYIGAVFRGGQNEPYLVSPELVVRLDPEKQLDRRRFVYRNLHAFNSLYLKSAKMNAGWLNATQNYETDLRVAKEKGAKITSAELESSNEFLRAAMAVTASARAMEVSEGSFDGYGKALTGGEKGTDAGWQDTWDAYILHADPNKIISLLNDPLVKKYYDRLMKDLGVEQNGESEWHGDKYQTPRKISFDSDGVNMASNGAIHYVQDEGKHGGFDAYIDKVLVKEVKTTEVDTRVIRAAAKLACDIFLVDKWTEYLDIVNKSNMSNKPSKLQPIPKGWGGDPFDFVLHPTGLQRLKGVYKGSDVVVLDNLDSGLRPVDIYEKLDRVHMSKKGDILPSKIRLPIASGVTNIKTLNRQAQLINRVTGGPMAPNLSVWSGPALNDLMEAERLIAQVLGTQEVETGDGLGQAIAGAQIIRIYQAKLLANALETLPPDSGDALRIVFDPDSKMRPLYDARSFLMGPEFNFKQGHLQALQGGDFSFTIADNPFAKKELDVLLELLKSNDQSGKLNATLMQRIGSGIRVGQSIANALGLVGSR